MSSDTQSEGVRMLDDFVCKAIPYPDEPLVGTISGGPKVAARALPAVTGDDTPADPAQNEPRDANSV